MQWKITSARRRFVILLVAMTLIMTSLNVVSAMAGTLEPPENAVDGGGDPAPTMKTLEQVPQTWSQRLSCATQANCPRFQMLSRFVNGFLDLWGVLDHETGLVWEKSPSLDRMDWLGARRHCANLRKGGRQGWILPSINRLSSLVDPSVARPAPTLPAGHPFTGVHPVRFWSAALFIDDPALVWFVTFSDGLVNTTPRDFNWRAWCVRADQSTDAY